MKKVIVTVAAIATLATGAMAQDNKAVKARQGQFQILALNLGVLGGMAKGAVEYDAEQAQKAADSVAGIAMVDQHLLFPEGTDNMSIDGTRALPAIWEGMDDFHSKWAALGEAASQGRGGGVARRRALRGRLGRGDALDRGNLIC